MKLNKSVFRVMGENKGPYLGMFYLVLLSSFLFVFFTLAAANLSTNKDAYFRDYVQGDLEFYSAAKIENCADIEQSFGLIMEETLVREYSFAGKTLRLFTPNDKVNITALTEGKLPLKNEIALDPQFAKANGYKIGSSINIDEKAYSVSGYICLPNYAYILQKEGDLVNNPNLFGIGVLSKEDLTEGNILYSLKFQAPQDNIYEQAKPLKAFLNEKGVTILSWDYAKYNMKTNMPNVEVLAISVYSFVLPPLIMLLSAVLVAVVLGRMIKNQTGVIGTLYALGYRKKEIMRHYLSYPLLLGLSGGALGGILGLVGFKPMLGVMLTFFPMPIKQITFNPLFILLSIILSVLILCFGTYLALNKVLKKSPVSLMRNESKVKKQNALERKLRLSRLKFNLKFKVREQLRSIPRLTFLLIGVLAATLLLMFGLITKSSLDHLISQEGNETLRYKFEYALKTPQTTPPPLGGEAIAGRKFVPDFDPKSRFEIIGVSPKSQVVNLFDLKGDPLPLAEGKVIISKSMAKKYGLKAFDTISFSDIISDKDQRIQITQVAATNIGDYLFVPLEMFDEMLGWEKGAYNAIMADAPLKIDEELVYKISTPENLTAALADYLVLMNSVIYGIALVAAIIGLIIMYILAGISIDENKGGIALMKVFGYKKNEVNSLIVNGSRVFVILGFFISVPLSYLLIGGLLTTVFGLVNLTIEPRLDWYYILIGFILIYLAFEISKALALRKIGKVSMSEALKGQRE